VKVAGILIILIERGSKNVPRTSYGAAVRSGSILAKNARYRSNNVHSLRGKYPHTTTTKNTMFPFSSQTTKEPEPEPAAAALPAEAEAAEASGTDNDGGGDGDVMQDVEIVNAAEAAPPAPPTLAAVHPAVVASVHKAKKADRPGVAMMVTAVCDVSNSMMTGAELRDKEGNLSRYNAMMSTDVRRQEAIVNGTAVWHVAQTEAIKKLFASLEPDTVVNLLTFSGDHKWVFKGIRADQVGDFDLDKELFPVGRSTAIHNAVDAALAETEVLATAFNAQKVSFSIMTDGEDNSSKPHLASKNAGKISTLVNMCKWQVLYMAGGGQDVQQTAKRQFGVDTNQQLEVNWTKPTEIAAAGRAASQVVAQYRSLTIDRDGAGAPPPAFTQFHRETSCSAPMPQPAVSASAPARPGLFRQSAHINNGRGCSSGKF